MHCKPNLSLAIGPQNTDCKWLGQVRYLLIILHLQLGLPILWVLHYMHTCNRASKPRMQVCITLANLFHLQLGFWGSTTSLLLPLFSYCKYAHLQSGLLDLIARLQAYTKSCERAYLLSGLQDPIASVSLNNSSPTCVLPLAHSKFTPLGFHLPRSEICLLSLHTLIPTFSLCKINTCNRLFGTWLQGDTLWLLAIGF